MSIQDDYRARHPKAQALAERARKAIPGGITHDIRHLVPYPVYVDRAAGDELNDLTTEGPFTFESLKKRYAYKLVTTDEPKSASTGPSAPRPGDLP